jgi:hypothetical protein
MLASLPAQRGRAATGKDDEGDDDDAGTTGSLDRNGY